MACIDSRMLSTTVASPGRRLRHWLIASKLHVVMKSTKVQTLGTTLVLWTHRICKMMISYIAKNSMTKLSSKILTCSIGSALGLSRMAYTAMHVRQHYARVTIHACQSWQNCNWLQVTTCPNFSGKRECGFFGHTRHFNYCIICIYTKCSKWVGLIMLRVHHIVLTCNARMSDSFN